MRRLWLVAFVGLILIDLAVLPTVVLSIFVGSVLTTHGAVSLASILLAAALGAGQLWLTFVAGRAWHRESVRMQVDRRSDHPQS
jgi:membrane protein DedA with SNARE-associated domain